MKIIASGDNHCDEGSRWAEWLRIHGWMVELVAEQKPDLFVCPGDIYERASTPRERAAVADWLTAIARHCPVIVIKGNHDRRLDCAFLSRLKSDHPIYVEEGASVQYVAGAAIACVAWPERAQIAAASAVKSGEAIDATAHDALRSVLAGLGAQLAAHQGPRILAGHFMVDGSVTSVGQPLIGQSMNVGLADLASARADITLMSHIHCPQDWTFDGAPIVYCGSPFRTTYGETETKSVVVATFGEDGRIAKWERVPTPCAPMLLLEGEWDGDFLAGATWHSDDVRGAEIRLRYRVAADQRESARAYANGQVALLLAAAAVDVKLEERVIATSKARAPEVATAKTLADKLRALWAARNDAPDADRAETLINLAHEIETEEAAE